MQNGQKNTHHFYSASRVSGLVPAPVQFQLDHLCRKMRNERGWDFGKTFAQVVLEGIKSVSVSA